MIRITGFLRVGTYVIVCLVVWCIAHYRSGIMDSTDAQGGSAESLLYIFPAPIFSPPQRNRPSHGNGQSATALWPIVAESRGGFHGRDHYFFS